MAKITGGPSLPMTCVCCMATMLLTKSTPASAAATPFLTYTPDTNVDDVAYLDLDQRSILASLAASDEDGLVDAKNTYMLGRVGSTGAMTMKRLSTLAEEEFLGVSSTYQDFVDYFGHTDYADRWISAAFGGLQTTLSDDANVNFSQLGVEGRGAAISWGLPLLHVWIFVVALLEKAIVNCRLTGDNTIPISFLDKAVALYTGSETRDDNNYGFFPYTLTQTEGYKFGTCKKDEMCPVNKKIFDKFRSVKSNLVQNECTSLQTNVRDIKELMTIVLFQGVTRSIYELDIHDDFQETTQAMGAAFAAALVPLLHSCSKGYATMVHNDLAPGKSTKGSYEVVKDAIEQNYNCLGISCEDVGGLVDIRGEGYLAGAEACNGIMPVKRDGVFSSSSSGGGSSSSSGSSGSASSSAYVPPATSSNFNTSNSKNDTTTYIIIIAVLSGICVALCITLLVCMCKNKRRAKKNAEENGRVFTASLEMTENEDNQAAADKEAAEKEII